MTDDDVFAAFPDIRIDRDNVDHYRGLMEQRLLIDRCDRCKTWVYPHRPICPACLSWDLTPTEVSGEGHLHMWTLIYQSRDPDSPIVEPIVAAAVELAEQPGLRYLSRVVNCPPDTLAHDMKLRLTWIDDGGRQMPAFEPD